MTNNVIRLIRGNKEPKPTSVDTKYPRAITATVEKLADLSQLGENWDGYGALCPTQEAIVGAMSLALELFEEGTPLPDVFPTPNGSIQFEWSCFGLDLEIEAISNRRCIASFEDLGTGEHWERSFTFDFTDLRRKVAELTDRSKAAMALQVVNA
jgi:hypothetical protein